MKIIFSQEIINRINQHGEAAYPEEGAGFLFGQAEGESRKVMEIYPLNNAREDAARHNRYLITPQDMLKAELAAEEMGLAVLGVFHSHPDHPDQPSEFDREWAMPYFSYVITSVQDKQAVSSRSWRLKDDRSSFVEEVIQINEEVEIEL